VYTYMCQSGVWRCCCCCCGFRYIFKQGHADAWLHLYTNGKSAVRPDAPGVTQGGPHVFLGPADKRWATPDNPHGLWHPAISSSTLVLHYAYTTPGDVAVKAGRSCPENVVEAVLAGDVAQVGGASQLCRTVLLQVVAC
jgi:hypothetical protein